MKLYACEKHARKNADSYLSFSSHTSPCFSERLASVAIARRTDFGLFIPNFKSKFDNSENIKADCVTTVVSNLPQFKQRNFFGTVGSF